MNAKIYCVDLHTYYLERECKMNESTEDIRKEENHEEGNRNLATFPMLGMREYNPEDSVSPGGDRSISLHVSDK